MYVGHTIQKAPTKDEFVKDIVLITEATEALLDMHKDMYNNLAALIINCLPAGCPNLPREELSNVTDVVFPQIEAEVKEKHNITAMPTSYRSAKSVLLKAIANEVDLVDPRTDKIVPKSELEKRIKSAQNSTEQDSTEDDHDKVLTGTEVMLTALKRAEVAATVHGFPEIKKVLAQMQADLGGLFEEGA